MTSGLVDFSADDQEPVCVKTSQGNIVSVKTYTCFAVTETTAQSYGVLMVIHVLPDSSSTQIQFQQESYTTEVMEGVQGAPVLGGGGIQAISLPITSLLTPSYRILNGHGPFALTEYSALCSRFLQLHTTQELDREMQDYYELTIEAYTAQVSATTMIKVYVLDRNDKGPEFQLSPESTTVSESSLRIGGRVTQFQASDDDLGFNARLSYSLSPFSHLFTINPFTGSVYRYSSQILEQATRTVGVFDLGSPQHEIQSNLTIFIETEHQQVLLIHDPGPLVASESELTSHVVGTIHITYSSSGSLVVGLTSFDCNCFKLATLMEDSDGEYTVDLMINSPLDFEVFPNGVNVTVTATDSENLQYTATKTFIISILDENEPPVFCESEYEISVSEGTPIGSVILQVEASDPDNGTNGELLYTFIDPPQGNPFSLENSGIVRSVSEINYETLQGIEITIMVEDGGGKIDQTMLEIYILDRNDQQPTFPHAHQTVEISESILANESIFHFSASDGDSQCNGAISYSIVYAEPPSFHIDHVSGLLYPLEDDSIDFEQFQSATVVVRASDLAGGDSEFTDTVLHIDIDGVNDERPQISQIECPCFMMESYSTMQSCQPLSASDADSNILTFTFHSGNEQNLFSISPQTGIVSTTEILPYEPGLEFNLQIIASDGELESEPEILKIIVVDDNNDMPAYGLDTIQIIQPVDTPIGSLLGNVSVQNGDSGYNALTEYAIINSAGVEDVIRIDALSGKIYLNSAPQLDQYMFSVTATDGLNAGSIATASVSIQFSGELNQPPKFQTTVDHIDIASNSQTNEVLYTFTAEDTDSGSDGLLTYSLASPSNFFQVHANGSLSLSNSLSEEIGSKFTLIVQVSDGGTPSLSDTLELKMTVYESSISIGGETFVYNPGIGIQHSLAVIPEETSQSLQVLQLPATEGSNEIQYAILPQGEFFSAFSIQNQNQVFSKENFQHVFDRANNEAVFITIRAQYASNFHYFSLTVVITDVNNNGPVFNHNVYSVEIYRNTPQGGYVFEFDAQDPDIGSNAITTYTVDPPSDAFAIVEGTAFLEVTLSELQEDSYSLTVVASDADSDTLPTDIATLEITVLETTNSQPIINPVTQTVGESAFGSLLSVTVSDTDSGSHGTNKLCIASGNVDNNFQINDDGNIFLLGDLDYEIMDTFTLSIMAYDSSLNPASSVTQVRILVDDENDEPKFIPESYIATVVENNPAVTSVLTVTAFDEDLGDLIEYSIENGTTAFSVDSVTGVVSTTAPLNRESVTQHSFIVSATDEGGKVSFASVLVKVLDENDNDPIFFSPNFVGVREDTPLETQVIQLEAMDDDEGQNSSVKFEIVSGNDENIFTLDPFTGSVTLGNSLDFESGQNSFVLTFRVSDLGFPPRTSSVTHQITFSLENANDNFPVFSSQLYSCSILEGSNSFSPPCQVSATDEDESDSASYRIVSGNTESAFQINSLSGIISRQMPIDREEIPRYFLKVEATDTGSPPLSSYTLVVVEVQDDNDDFPKFDPVIASHIPEGNIRLSQMYFSEALPQNTLLFFAHAVDSDVGDNGEISYNIIDSSPELFQIDSNTSAVFLIGSLNFERSPTHNLVIQATNPSGTATSHAYTINVMNEKENLFPPVFSPDTPPAVSISKNAPIGAHLTSVNATDADPEPGGEVKYYITAGSAYGYFTINQSNGEISVLYDLTGIEVQEVALDILASDFGYPSLSTSFTLAVFLEPDDDAKPFFIHAMYSTLAPEAFTAQNTIFGSVQAFVNGRPACDVTYSIVSGNEERFSINASSGAISKVSLLNRELESMYTLFVSASLGSVSNTSYALVAIEVADSNDHTPSFVADFDVTIFNDHPTGLGSAFMRVFAVDQDIGENGRLEYSIIDNSGNFAIDSSSGDLYLVQSLPAESTAYDVTVSVMDMATLPLSQSTTFTISTIPPAMDDNSPSFSTSSTSIMISEDVAPGILLYTAQASDISSEHLVYRITDPLPNFAIMPNSGEVFLIKPLDREEEQQYTIRIEASDGSRISSIFLLNVLVEDINDNRPVFTIEEFVFTVEEHSENGEVVGSVSATDDDDANTITYTLVDAEDHNSIDLFSLSDGGTLQVAGTIDRESRPVHILTVSAEDDGTPSLASYARVKVMVADINDHAPAFVAPLKNTSISENTTVGTSFFNVSVFDPDTGAGNSLSYSLSPQNTPFAINASTGELYVAMELDAERQAAYTLEIGISSEDMPTETTTTTLVVTIVDELDSFPILSDPGTVHLSENLPPYSIVALVGDNVSLTAVYYEIVLGNKEDAFFVEPLTGIVRTSTPLDRESTSSYTLTVQGTFQANYKASVIFTVLVDDVNDNSPSFSSQFLEYTLPEDSFTLALDFTDNDEGENNEIGDFYIPDPRVAKAFTIDSSGNIQVRQLLDREGKFDTIDFDLYLFDSGNPPLYDLAHVSITVSDVNDNPPYFLQSSYSFVVSLPAIVDTILFSVQAKDLDEDATVSYAIVGGNGTNKFSINAITGGISITNNYRLQSYYSLTLSAKDEGGKESFVSVEIITKHCGFTNLLFNPRDFSKSLLENVANNTVVFSPNLLTFDVPADIVYSFSTADSLFEINDITGVVSLNGYLDREQQSTHQFTVQARDTNNPLRLAQADIEIIVEDVNDNVPMFVSAPYVTYITGDHSGDIIRVRAVDRDEGSNGEVSYQLKVGCSGLFEVEENTGQISLTEELDMFLLDSCTLTVIARDKGETPLSASTTVTVNVVLSNAPLFSMNGVYSAQVNESASRDTLVITVLATATSDDPHIRYNIESPQSNTLPFSIDFVYGHVTVNGIGLDYETNSSYRLQLEAVDLTTTLTGRATLDIQVLDENDNRPEFSLALYQSSLTENSDVGTLVEQVSASDLDSGSNSDIVYFIDPSDIATTLFNIDEESGFITTSAVIDREENNFIRFAVLARDEGSPSLTGTTTVQIEVQDVNDNAPYFLQSSYRGTVLEEDQSGTSILFVTATDPDNDEVDYNIVTSPGSSNFEISPSGLISLTTSASELSDVEYQFQVSAFDGLFFGYAEVIIELENENNNAPVFNASTYTAFILENATIGAVVLQVFATDDDRGENGALTYTMSSSLFEINSESGVITVSTGLDREANPNGVSLIVIARDGGGRTGTAEIDIELGDINDNPPVFTQTMYGFDVQETTQIGTTVSTIVSANDPDAGSNGLIQYTINPTTDSTQFPFDIDEESGAIRTILNVDPTVESEYIFTVGARDMGEPEMSADPLATVTVQVTAAGEVPPQFQNTTYHVSIPENNQYGTHLLTPQLVMTSETIECDIITYSLLNNDNLFQLVDDSISNITVTTIFNREEMALHVFSIQAECLPLEVSHIVRAFAVIYVNVLDVNEAPSFSSAFLIGHILEGIPLGTILEFNGGINFVEAGDEDEGENGIIAYSITEDVPFSIHSHTGIITVSDALDRETTDIYRFDVFATDLGNPPLSDSIRIRVNIEDINDSPPVFQEELYSGEVVENAGVGTPVLTVTASDADLDNFAVNTYSVSGSETFTIGNTTGILSVVGGIDRETTSMYTLVITATDGIQHDSTTVVINVTDVNDNPPIFNDTQYDIEVAENYETGIVLFQVFASDSDLGANAEISYGILEDQQLLHINSSTGEVSFSQTPDYEMSPQGHFEFRVTATNPNDESQRALSTLIIDLLDLNDNAPMFRDQTGPIHVAENQPSDITVVRVEADDLDSGINSRVEYSLSEEAAQYFTIDSQTGTIKTRVTFNREANSSYEVSVTATDMGTPPLSGNTTLLIGISDVNDNPPVFPHESYTVRVLESVSVGSTIENIRADDSDEGTNAEIMYRHTGDNSAHFLIVMLDDGSFNIEVAQELNHENIDIYNLNITAFDGGFPFLQATVPITIIVQDENDNPPEFDPPFYTVQFPENLRVGSEITRVQARDPDSVDATQLTYSFLEPQNHPLFEIGTFSGYISLAQPLDFEEEQVHIIIVQADDQVHSATASVVVTVTNINDNAPEFVMQNFTQTITENVPGDTLFDFTVHDRDRDSDPSTISFKIESGNSDGIFHIQPTSGILSFEEFDFEALSTSEYLLTITASDNEDPPLAGTAYVTIVAQDINDNPPEGENQVIYVFLYNGQLTLRTLGTLLIRDPDTVNDHQFNVTGGNSNIFLIQFGGEIEVLQHPPPPGVYSFTVHVTDGDLGEAITTVDISVVNITDAHLENSFTMRLLADSVESFLDIHLQEFLKSLETLVMEKTSIRGPKAYLFDITQSGRSTVDITLAVESANIILIHQNLIQHLIHINRDLFKDNGVVILTENVDRCADESACNAGTVCTKNYQYRSASQVMGSAAASIVGIDRSESIVCSSDPTVCSVLCPEPSFCFQENGESICIDSCARNPCKNNGQCHEQMPGYYCSCPAGFDGRNCELTTSYFHEGSYAIFPAITTSTNGTITIEFVVAERENGLLFYSSRFDDNLGDFLALEIIDDHLSLYISYGSDPMRLSLLLNGNGWYIAIIDYTSTVSIHNAHIVYL